LNLNRNKEEKLVIFTEHRDTLTSLKDRLEDKGYAVTIIHGQMDVDNRKIAQREFKTKKQIMVATDAAGEGINLQFCRFLINWDIPWNPNRLEQRMGRIHRYGQKDEVWVYNLVAQNTREGKVLQRILEKLDTMREQIGDDRVYDVIDELLDDVPLVKLIESAIDSVDESDMQDKIDFNIETITNDKARDIICDKTSKTPRSALNLSAARELKDASDEIRLQPDFIKSFFERAWTACMGTIQKDIHFPVWHLSRTPSALLNIARVKGKLIKEHYDTPFVFDKSLVSVASDIQVPEGTKLLGPGHILFDTLIEWAIKESRDTFAKGSVIVDPEISEPKRVYLVRSWIEDNRKDQRKRVADERLVLILEDNRGLSLTSPAELLDCVPPEGVPVFPNTPGYTEDEIKLWAYEEITEPQKDNAVHRRLEECAKIRKYLETAFTDLIRDRIEELNDLQEASLFGEENHEEQKLLQQRIEELKTRKVERLYDLSLMEQLSASLPDLLTQAIVIPAPNAVDETKLDEARTGMAMRRDDEVEAIAMEIAMKYEESRGWESTDVSKEGFHFDVRSVSPSGEKRYIEVKGRAQSGAIVITEPELNKLRQLENRAWLYIVTHCKSDSPKLKIIQNPISKVKPEMLYRQIQYLVDEKNWSSQGEEVPI
ncbi:DUF3883 domain-containing protein, partial [bacterium]|nr:DUF3883 domain-containing protein [bacterium]MBU1025463.1 DUF3883 domain-containing protein [bacterium]